MADFEERADQLSLDAIQRTLSDGEIFRNARKKLLAPGAKLLVGPRGTGKTHIMRQTYLHGLRRVNAPLPLYANFSRYLSLEPLLKTSPDALKRFHSWVVAKLLLSCFEFISDSGDNFKILARAHPLFDESRLREFVGLLERGSGKEEYESFGQQLTVGLALEATQLLCKHYRRTRAVFLLDDAALSLAGEYLVAFFEIYRLLKTEVSSPKASVYPGSTQYGPSFHASHEVEEVYLWLSVEDTEYSSIMGDIASKRFSQQELDKINPDALETLKYAAFGSPRAFLRLIREFLDAKSPSLQQKLNQLVERHTELVGAEYDSLKIKLKQFASIIEAGRFLFDGAVTAIVAAQKEEPARRQMVLGIREDTGSSPLTERMLRFLVEVGMLYPLNAVSHGPNRRYRRFIVHLAFLQYQGGFRAGRGSSARDVPSYMERPPAKHPVRREISSLLDATHQAMLKLDLPACQNCDAARLNESQRFCHICGERLVASSLFEDCMGLPLENVPGISGRLLGRIHSDTSIRTVGHVFASQNAAGDLQRASYVGPVRANDIVTKVAVAVNEFLS